MRFQTLADATDFLQDVTGDDFTKRITAFVEHPSGHSPATGANLLTALGNIFNANQSCYFSVRNLDGFGKDAARFDGICNAAARAQAAVWLAMNPEG